MADDPALPDFPGPSRSAGAAGPAGASGPAAATPMAGGNPPQGDHRGAGGRPEHYMADGGIGVGAAKPFGWPEHKMPD